MNAIYQRRIRKFWSATALFLGLMVSVLPSYGGMVNLNNYNSPGVPQELSAHVNAIDNSVNISVNNNLPSNLKLPPYVHEDVYKPAVATLRVGNINLSGLSGFNVSAMDPYGSPKDGYEANSYYGLIIVDGGNRSSGTLNWDMKNFNSSIQSGFGSMVQIGGGVVNNDPIGESVNVNMTGTNTFGSYTYFGGRGTSKAGNGTVTFTAGSKTYFNNNAEANFGGGTYSGTAGTGYVYFNGGYVDFSHQNAYFGGNAKMGQGGDTFVYFNNSDTKFLQRAVFGGIGFLNTGKTFVEFNGGSTIFSYDETTESNYRGVYFSAMAYHDPYYNDPNHQSYPYAYGVNGGATVNFHGGTTTFNTLTIFGGSYNLDRIGGGDMDRTWGGDVVVNIDGGKNYFKETTYVLRPSTDPNSSRFYYRWEGGTYFGGPGSNVNINVSGGETYFLGSYAGLSSPSDPSYNDYSANVRAYTNALANANGYTIFNSTNYADDVQFGGRWLEVGDCVSINGQIVELTDQNINQYQSAVRSSTDVNISCGRVTFDNVRATFGGRQGYYLRYNSYIDPADWASKDSNAIYGWSGGITEDFFTNPDTMNIDGQNNRLPNLFDDSTAVARLNLHKGGELRIGVNALLIGTTEGTTFTGNKGTVYYDFKLANGLPMDTYGNDMQQLDVGAIYFNNINLNNTVVDIALEQIQELNAGLFKTDIALMTDDAYKMNFNDYASGAYGKISASNRFYDVYLQQTFYGDGSMYSLVVDVKKQIGVYEDGIGNVAVNRREINDLINHHSDDAAPVANAMKEVLKKSNNSLEEAANFDLMGGAIYSSMISVQNQRLWTINNLLVNQIYAEDAGRNCYGGNCQRGACGAGACDTGGCYTGGCGYNCGGYACGDAGCGQGGGGTYGGQVVYDELGNPYPVFTDSYFPTYRKPRFTLWARAYGFSSDVTERKGFSGYDSESMGGVFGMQFRIRENGRFGIYYAYGQTRIESEATMGNAWIESVDHTIGLYGKWENPERCGYHFLNANYSFNSYDSYRLFNQDSCTYRDEFTGDYDSHTTSVFFEKGWDYCLWQRWTINPYFNSQWMHYSGDSFRESGGDLALEIDDLRYDSFRTSLGSRFSLRCIHLHSNHDLRFTTNIAWVHEWLEGQPYMNSMAVSAPHIPKWKMYGNDGGISWVNVGVGLNYAFRDRLTFGFNYDLMANAYTTAHAGMASATIAW